VIDVLDNRGILLIRCKTLYNKPGTVCTIQPDSADFKAFIRIRRITGGLLLRGVASFDPC
jgi:hypothetical protein